MTTRKRWLPSASSGGRTIECEGWSALTYIHRNNLIPEDSKYSQPGTDAHRILELMQLGKKPKKKKDKAAKGRLKATDDEQRHFRAVEFGNTTINRIIKKELKRDPKTNVYPESVVTIFDDSLPHNAYTGTIDIAVVNSTSVTVIDYKHGVGVPVNVENNWQTIGYLFGALGRAIDDGIILDPNAVKFTAWIIQPRCLSVDPVQSFTYDYATLLSMAMHLRTKLHTAKMLRISAMEDHAQPDIMFLNRGDHCQFCPVKVQCPKWSTPAGKVVHQYITDTHERAGGYPKLKPKALEQLYLDSEGIKGYLAKLQTLLSANLAQGKGAGLVKQVEGGKRRALIESANYKLQGYLKNGKITREQFNLCFTDSIVGRTDLRHILPTDVYDSIVQVNSNRPFIVSINDRRPSVSQKAVATFAATPAGKPPKRKKGKH